MAAGGESPHDIGACIDLCVRALRAVLPPMKISWAGAHQGNQGPYENDERPRANRITKEKEKKKLEISVSTRHQSDHTSTTENSFKLM